jgi:hypothetical protein
MGDWQGRGVVVGPAPVVPRKIRFCSISDLVNR